MDGDPTFFGRAGFRGWGARADIVLTRGVVLAVEGFELRPVCFVMQIFMGAPMMAYSRTLLDEVDGIFLKSCLRCTAKTI